MSTPTKVIISGAGIAGPVLAMFLKLKGYEPVVYERTEKISGLGLSLILQPNGLRVLSLIPGLVEKIVGKELESIRQCSIVPEDEGVLADSDAIPRISDDLGSCILATRQLVFNRTLVDTAESLGVKIVWGHQLVALKQADGSVEVAFANGATDTASFVVGCDGLHSNTRTCLFGQEQADFTGLTQTGGISPTPEVLSKRATLMNIYGDGVHMVSYPISDTHTSWAITVQESEAKETWRSMDEERQKEFKEGPISKWGFGAGELVSTADKIVKYGLYDRPELPTWHKGRVVLLGDAAHPTSPHLGQGANQAFEDIYHLVRLLVKHNPSAESPSTAVLSDVFSELERIRIPRASELVKGARRQGESRVVHGVDACKTRNDGIRNAWKDTALIVSGYEMMFGTHPFPQGQSEI